MAGPEGALPRAALKGGAVGAVVGGAVAVAEGAVLGALGFTAVGPAAGSWAAMTMSGIALGNGVGVTTGSFYALAQSAAMGGGAILGAPFVVACAAVGAVAWWSIRCGDGGGAPCEGDAIASATDLDEGAKGEMSSEEDGTEGNQPDSGASVE